MNHTSDAARFARMAVATMKMFVHVSAIGFCVLFLYERDLQVALLFGGIAFVTS